MLIHNFKTCVVILLLFITQSVYAQYATEIFIPLGQSPGISAKHTTIGNINSVNIPGKTISMSDAGSSYNIKISEDTQIWLDQSRRNSNNRNALIQDLREGMRAEVKYIKNNKGGTVEWIKVQPAE